ncbi:MAG: glycosyltransferase family 39 protein [Hyphomicrobiaceae bacterium]|nr:glycosyltransferase family 39 protein [Hyphomicrobiaceae bacterium]
MKRAGQDWVGRSSGGPITQPINGFGGSRSDARWVLAMLVGLAALLAARIAALSINGTDLFFDEAQYWSWSLVPDLGYYSKPPMIAWLIRGSTEVCGVSEFCIRLPSPILHTLTALAVFALARRLYDTVTGVLSALVFATLPGVSLSAGIISTDVPLLLGWALALFAFVALRDTRSWWPALLLGVALGFGLNAKYAMIWFALCAAVYLVATPADRRLVRDVRLWFAVAVALALIAPNLWWNLEHKFATFAHTADNAKWDGALLNPLKALEFFGAQFGVFGPVLFAALGVITWRAWREGIPAADRLLLAFSLPVVIVITLQALVSRAHANWAAVSYVAATVLVTATMLRNLDLRWLRGSMALHVALMMVLIGATAYAGRFALPSGVDPFARTLGWRAMADATRATLDAARRQGKPFNSVLTDDRAVTAELLYYMREEATPVYAWRGGPGRPKDHYELSRSFTRNAGEPVLLVGVGDPKENILARFASVRLIESRKVRAGAGKPRVVTFHALEGYREK